MMGGLSVNTQSGASIWPRGSLYYKSDTEVPTLTDIGYSLSRIVRFCGHTKEWYSVMLHSCTVADLVEVRFIPYALLHDAPEAIVSDVPSPWKTGAAKNYEDELLERITRHHMKENPHWELEWPWPQEASMAVARADDLALAAEAHVLGHPRADKWWPLWRYSEYCDWEIAVSTTEWGISKVDWPGIPMNLCPTQAIEFAQNPHKGAAYYESSFPHSR